MRIHVSSGEVKWGCLLEKHPCLGSVTAGYLFLALSASSPVERAGAGLSLCQEPTRPPSRCTISEGLSGLTGHCVQPAFAEEGGDFRAAAGRALRIRAPPRAVAGSWPAAASPVCLPAGLACTPRLTAAAVPSMLSAFSHPRRPSTSSQTETEIILRSLFACLLDDPSLVPRDPRGSSKIPCSHPYRPCPRQLPFPCCPSLPSTALLTGFWWGKGRWGCSGYATPKHGTLVGWIFSAEGI